MGVLLYEKYINRRTCCKFSTLYYRFKRYTVRGAAKKFRISKSTAHKDVTLKNGLEIGQIIPKSIEIKKFFLAEKNPVVKLGLVIK